ncbi:MAG: acyl transferase [Cyclobacteriaceae bacterium]
MNFYESFQRKIFRINSSNFDECALSLFEYQFNTNETYRSYCELLSKNPSNVFHCSQIPFLPIDCFKNHEIRSETWQEEIIFYSSGTTNSGRSKSFVRNVSFYHKVAKACFEHTYGSLLEHKIIALLPSYLEQPNSSLISMVQSFITHSMEGSGFYSLEELTKQPELLAASTLLLGVSYALLDLAAIDHKWNNPELIVMETGGMKGRRKEMLREELHDHLKAAFNVPEIHSEYGMCELSSQSYAKKEGVFIPPQWMKIIIRDMNDPFNILGNNQSGGVNIIDLSNISTCAFIETKDIGQVTESNEFRILGRMDNSDIRGCNLLI